MAWQVSKVCRETRLDELLVFAGDVRGLAVDLDEETIGCVLLGETSGISAGSIVRGSGEVAHVPVGDALLGRVVDALGIPLDGNGPLETAQFCPLSSRRRRSCSGRWSQGL